MEKNHSLEHASKAPPKPQDGATAAWLQVLGSAFVMFNIWGFVNAFGTFATFYQTDLLSSHSPAEISWIGSIDGFLLIVFGVISGPIFDYGYFRTMLVAGSLVFVFGVMMLSLADQFYQILLAQGVCLGLASGVLYTPSLALVATSFTKRRGLAVGLATSGGSLGGVVYPIMFRQLVPRLGFGWTTRIMGFLALGCFLLSFCIMLPKQPKAPGKSRRLVDTSALKEPPFLFFTVAGFFIFLAYFVPFFYITTFSRTIPGMDDLAFYILAIVNAGNFFGRIIPGYIADIVGPMQTLISAALVLGIGLLAWIAVNSVAGTIVWAIFFGFFAGILVSVPAAVLPLLCPSPDVVGSRLGMAWTGAGVGILIGNPIAGALTNARLEHFWQAQVFAGVVMLFGTTCYMVPLRYIIRRSRVREDK